MIFLEIFCETRNFLAESSRAFLTAFQSHFVMVVSSSSPIFKLINQNLIVICKINEKNYLTRKYSFIDHSQIFSNWKILAFDFQKKGINYRFIVPVIYK